MSNHDISTKILKRKIFLLELINNMTVMRTKKISKTNLLYLKARVQNPCRKNKNRSQSKWMSERERKYK